MEPTPRERLNNILTKLRTLDIAAADYVLKLYEEGSIEDDDIIDDNMAITWLFCWSEQPQGRTYWSNLYHQYTELPLVIKTKLGNALL